MDRLEEIKALAEKLDETLETFQQELLEGIGTGVDLKDPVLGPIPKGHYPGTAGADPGCVKTPKFGSKCHFRVFFEKEISIKSMV